MNPIDKATLIEPMYRAGIRFRLLVVFLLAVIGWGVYMYYRQVTIGLGETGLNRPVFWGVYMVNFIFLIGVSMAGTLISAALLLTGANWRRPITRIAETLTVFGLLVAGLQILVDMGRPDKLLALIPYGRLQSPLLWDATSLSVYILASMGALYLQLLPDIALLRDNVPEGAPAWRRRLYSLLALSWRGNRTQWLRLEKAIKIISVLIIMIGISLHTVTSWIFSTTVQPGWKSTILGPYFVVGAIFSGIGMLLIVATVMRQRLRLSHYIKPLQYRNLRVLFIVMSITWFYFTYTEHLTIIAAQEVMEFPVLASKLWGEFAWSFWGMVVLMVLATWVLIGPMLLPRRLQVLTIFTPRALLFQTAALVILAAWYLIPTEQVPAGFELLPAWRPTVVALIGLLLLSLALGSAAWLKDFEVTCLIIASVCVVAGMWLERWNIIVPTVTHPRLIPYAGYWPTVTEVAITLASVAMLVLGPLLFFKIFPAVSIWEVAEGRVLDAAEAAIEIPPPEAVPTRRHGRMGFRKFEPL